MIDNDSKIQFIGAVKLDFSACDEKDFYSDGSIEDEILFHVRAGNTENFLRNDNRFPVICHLSPLRNFLLEWLPIGQGDSVLEIGCGLGALTGTLLNTGAQVEAVEISPRRAQICALRNRDANNLTIRVGNLNAMTFNKKFDFVVLVGVLEYAARFTRTKNPYEDFLNKCKSFLKADGSLVLAIENRLGLEYLSGKLEDHTGRLFDGITDYPAATGIKTFSRLELKNMLASCGFVDQKFFYPYPDYKFPFIIHSDEMLPAAMEMSRFQDIFYDTNRIELFPMSRAWPTIINAGLYSELANSFLIIARQTRGAQRTFPLKIFTNNCVRKPEYSLRTEFFRASTASGLLIKKIARNPFARRHLRTMVENCQILSEIYGARHVAQMAFTSEDTAEMEFVAGTVFEDYLCRVLELAGVEGFVKLLTFYFQKILRGTDDPLNFPGDFREFDLPGRRYEMDLNFGNIILRGNDFGVFDYEFMLPTLPKKFIAFRTFKCLAIYRADLLRQHGITFEKLVATLELPLDVLREYDRREQMFQLAVTDIHDLGYRKRRLPVKGFNFS